MPSSQHKHNSRTNSIHKFEFKCLPIHSSQGLVYFEWILHVHLLVSHIVRNITSLCLKALIYILNQHNILNHQHMTKPRATFYIIDVLYMLWRGCVGFHFSTENCRLLINQEQCMRLWVTCDAQVNNKFNIAKSFCCCCCCCV